MENKSVFNTISSRARALEASKIREVAELGMKQQGVLPLWFGEGAWPTNPLIVDAAIYSLKSGNHMYQPNNGTMSLRQAICTYSNDLLGSRLKPPQITVTPSGMQGIMLTAEFSCNTRRPDCGSGARLAKYYGCFQGDWCTG
jgi:aspartate/methionine/tyrosine aminotransferase